MWRWPYNQFIYTTYSDVYIHQHYTLTYTYTDDVVTNPIYNITLTILECIRKPVYKQFMSWHILINIEQDEDNSITY